MLNGSWLRCWLQSDNTVKEIRNQYGSKLMIALTQSRTFNTTSHSHLRVGHTHEDVDAIFSLCTNALRTAQNIETPRDLQRLILQRVGTVFTKRALDFDLEIVEVVARFQDSVGLGCL